MLKSAQKCAIFTLIFFWRGGRCVLSCVLLADRLKRWCKIHFFLCNCDVARHSHTLSAVSLHYVSKPPRESLINGACVSTLVYVSVERRCPRMFRTETCLMKREIQHTQLYLPKNGRYEIKL